MLLLLILADDFTGALDTGVQFAACGIPTRVVVGEQVDFAANDTAVLVVDTETRHLPAAEAYAVIAKLTREAMSAGVFSIYKKTDSALRGNIGAELSALLKTSGERQLPFLPAFPQIASGRAAAPQSRHSLPSGGACHSGTGRGPWTQGRQGSRRQRPGCPPAPAQPHRA